MHGKMYALTALRINFILPLKILNTQPPNPESVLAVKDALIRIIYYL
jgi:hypothetical protein